MATTFSKKVLQIVSKIPRGSVMTYAQVARAAGRPNAYRAVGNILHRNPHPFRLRSEHPFPKGEGIVVPCHRVVKYNGEIGGYVGGVRRKVELLRKEGVNIQDGKIQNQAAICLTYEKNKNRLHYRSCFREARRA